jgi:hypothetical protein
VWATNHHVLNPRIVIARGEWGPAGYDLASKFLVDGLVKVDQSLIAGAIEVTRIENSDPHIRFDVYVRTP